MIRFEVPRIDATLSCSHRQLESAELGRSPVPEPYGRQKDVQYCGPKMVVSHEASGRFTRSPQARIERARSPADEALVSRP
jgi:hypothetical protein